MYQSRFHHWSMQWSLVETKTIIQTWECEILLGWWGYLVWLCLVGSSSYHSPPPFHNLNLLHQHCNSTPACHHSPHERGRSGPIVIYKFIMEFFTSPPLPSQKLDTLTVLRVVSSYPLYSLPYVASNSRICADRWSTSTSSLTWQTSGYGMTIWRTSWSPTEAPSRYSSPSQLIVPLPMESSFPDSTTRYRSSSLTNLLQFWDAL